jgi:hypothetical protein
MRKCLDFMDEPERKPSFDEVADEVWVFSEASHAIYVYSGSDGQCALNPLPKHGLPLKHLHTLQEEPLKFGDTMAKFSLCHW